MKTASAKAKGRRLQQDVARRIQDAFQLPESDVKSLPMGSQGCDIWMSGAACSRFPFGIECKNVEKLNVWDAFKQAERNAGTFYPLLVMNRNHNSEPLAVLKFSDLLRLLAK